MNQLCLILPLPMARRRDPATSHAAANFLMRESGYADPQPIEPEDEKARLEREFIAATKGLTSLVDRLARIGIKVSA